MRNTPIIKIIRRYGLRSRWLQVKKRIKYEDAVKGMLQFENNELKISEVIDNYLFPEKSKSNHCQLDGCGQKIRYEYVLVDKNTGKELVVGSTCVWPTLGFSEIEKDRFLGFEKSIKEYHSMLEWKKVNMDVVVKLDRLKAEGFNEFTPFWEELNYSALTQEDTDYLRNDVDVDKLIHIREEKKRRDAERKAQYEKYLQMAKEERERRDADYRNVINALTELIKLFPNNDFYLSLEKQSKLKRLSDKQIRAIKLRYNKYWYNTKIKGTKLDLPNYEQLVKDFANVNQISFPSGNVVMDFSELAKKIKEAGSNIVKLAWSIYRVKHEIVMDVA